MSENEPKINDVPAVELNALLDALKPFAEAAQGMSWESTPDHLRFFPVNAMAFDAKALTAGDMRRAMEVYAKYGI